jgi:L-lactate dehydrogenase complex protein LldG
MAEARDDILNAIRTGLKSALLPEATRDHPINDVPRPDTDLADFIANVEALSSEIIRTETSQQAADAVAELCRDRGWAQALSWDAAQIGCEGLPEALAAAGVEAITEGQPDALKGIPVGITGAEAGLADTGTVVVRSGSGRSQLASLLPPAHIVVMDAARVLPDMRSYFEALDAQGGAAAHLQEAGNLVFISGPSRTADIEQVLTLGVHGPRELFVVLWGAA